MAQMTIGELSKRDPIYQQHQELVAAYFRSEAQDEPPPPPLVLSYTVTEDQTLFEIASQLMLPYSTLATLNRLDNPSIPAGTELLVPTRPGIFLYESPITSLEERISRRMDNQTSGASGDVLLLPDRANAVRVRQFPGTDFSPEERQLFLQVVFDDPVPLGVVSSSYGYRHHPITGVWSFHYGIDLAADFGEAVRTAAEGRVTHVTRDPWLGLSIEIDHAGGYTTRYAHLQETFVSAGTFVKRGGTIGTVGSTGISTGPHLHFEVLRDGEHKNPIRYLQRDMY